MMAEKMCHCEGEKCKLTSARRERIRKEKCGGCRNDFYNWQRKADGYGIAMMAERIEALAETMHGEWLAVMAEQGSHPKDECPRQPYPNAERRNPPCPQCRDGLVPWSDLPEPVKEVNRCGARAMLKELGCVKDGEVVVPDVAGAAEALKRIGALNDPRRERDRRSALRALRGEEPT